MKKIFILLGLFLLVSSKSVFSQSVFVRGYSDTSGISFFTTPTTGLVQLTTTHDYIFCTELGFVTKTDSAGEPAWTKMLMSRAINDISIWDMAGNSNNEIFITGYKTAGDSDVVVKTDANGTILWSKYFSTHHLYLRRVVPCNNGDVLVLGQYTNPPDIKDFAVVIRISGSGNIKWQKVFLHPYYAPQGGHGNSKINDVTETSGSDLIFCGVANNLPGVLGNFMLKTDSAGTITWAKSLNAFTVPGVDEPHRIKSLSNGHIKMVLKHPIQGPTCHIGLAEFDAGGSVLNAFAFNDSYGSEISDALIEDDGSVTLEAGAGLYHFDPASAFLFGYTYLNQYSVTPLENILRAHDGGFILGGGFSNIAAFYADALLVKTDAAGITTGGRYVPRSLTTAVYSQTSVAATVVDSVISLEVSGTVQLAANSILKDTVFSVIAGINTLTGGENNFRIYPNPAGSEFYAHLLSFTTGESYQFKITDVVGKIIYRSEITESTSKLKIRTRDLPDGIYFVSLISKNEITTKKLIIQH